MAEIYAISMNKGGVGKTSLVTNLAGVLTREMNKRVLIVDTDGQGNSSIAFGRNPGDFKDTIYDVLMGSKKAEDVILHIEDNLDLIPANDDMDFLEFDILPNLKEYKKPFGLLADALEPLRDNYDYILIDTPPSMSLVAGNVFTCADKVLIPFVPETYAVKGLIRVMKAIEKFSERENLKLDISGIVGMMVDGRTLLHSKMLRDAQDYCGRKNIHVFETVIPRTIRFSNSTAFHGMPAVWTDPTNPLVGAYYELGREFIEHGERQ